MPANGKGSNPAHGTAKGKVLTFRKNSTPDGEYYWSEVDCAILRDAIDAVTRAGGAIMFGLTRDGGAFSICVLDGTQKAKEYPHGIDELHETLVGIRDYYKAD